MDTIVALMLNDLNTSTDRTKGDDEKLDLVLDCAGVMYFAAADATSETLSAFILAMAVNPLVVQRAHEEIDKAVGRDRLPSFEDREQLPYIEAIIWEVYRWHCVTPLGFPRAPSRDDVFDGYRIPEGTITWSSNWSTFYDPKMFPEPEQFKPERFLVTQDRSSWEIVEKRKVIVSAVWGWGRRVCPGRHTADNTMFLCLAQVLSVFHIGAPDGEKLKAKFGDARVRRPAPFKCSIRPRYKEAIQLFEE